MAQTAATYCAAQREGLTAISTGTTSAVCPRRPTVRQKLGSGWSIVPAYETPTTRRCAATDTVAITTTPAGAAAGALTPEAGFTRDTTSSATTTTATEAGFSASKTPKRAKAVCGCGFTATATYPEAATEPTCALTTTCTTAFGQSPTDFTQATKDGAGSIATTAQTATPGSDGSRCAATGAETKTTSTHNASAAAREGEAATTAATKSPTGICRTKERERSSTSPAHTGVFNGRCAATGSVARNVASCTRA